MINDPNCSGCSACFNICPQRCISMVEDKEGFLYPRINKEKCINCGLCKKACPALATDKYVVPSTFYACKSKNEELRSKSSSGGVFSSLAEYVIHNNGVVFGAAFNRNMELSHIGVNKKEDLSKLMGSKYLQSDLKNTFNEVKTYLCNNRFVLFSGTPCQVAGLKAYLQDDYKNLYLADLACHGVPSPKIFTY